MLPLLELTPSQIFFLDTVLRTSFYLGRASLNNSVNKHIKLYSFNAELLNMSLEEASLYAPKEELEPLWALEGSYVYSPYFKTVYKSLKDFCLLKRVEPMFPHVFFKEVPANIPLHPKGKLYTLLELNNRQIARRCANCGDIADMRFSMKCGCTITQGSLYNAKSIYM